MTGETKIDTRATAIKTRHVFLTGRPGSGKTTVVKRAVEGRPDVGGFYTGEIREAGKRTGFSITTLDGETGLLASDKINSPVRVGRYRVNLADIEGLACRSIESAIRDVAVRVVLIDEVASMEMASDRFKETVVVALESGKRVLGTIQDRRDPFIDRIRSRPDVSILRVDASSRGQLPEILVSWLETG
jgi:nucleoside-triphosphatase